MLALDIISDRLKQILFCFFFSISIYICKSQPIDTNELKYNNTLTLKAFNANSYGLGIGSHYERKLDSMHQLSLTLGVNLALLEREGRINIEPGIKHYFSPQSIYKLYSGFSIFLGQDIYGSSTYLGDSLISKTEWIRTRIGPLFNLGIKRNFKRLSVQLESSIGYSTIDINRFEHPLSFDSRLLGGAWLGFGYNF